MNIFGQTLLKRKGLWIGFALLFVTMFGLNLFFSNEAYGSKEEQVVVVQPGDTLWSIASQYYKGENIQEVIYRIKQTNHMQSPHLKVGAELRLPNF